MEYTTIDCGGGIVHRQEVFESKVEPYRDGDGWAVWCSSCGGYWTTIDGEPVVANRVSKAIRSLRSHDLFEHRERVR